MALGRNDKDIGNSGKPTGMGGSERKRGWVVLDEVIVIGNINSGQIRFGGDYEFDFGYI